MLTSPRTGWLLRTTLVAALCIARWENGQAEPVAQAAAPLAGTSAPATPADNTAYDINRRGIGTDTTFPRACVTGCRPIAESPVTDERGASPSPAGMSRLPPVEPARLEVGSSYPELRTETEPQHDGVQPAAYSTRPTSSAAKPKQQRAAKQTDTEPLYSEIRLHAQSSRRPRDAAQGSGSNALPITAVARAQLAPLPTPDALPQRPQTLSERLKLPTELPGANAPPLQLPEIDLARPEKRWPVIDQLFPELPRMGTLVLPPGARRAMSLTDLQNLAIDNSPVLAQAAAEVRMYLGDAIQQGLAPNPVIGYEADTVGSFFTRNYQGIYIQQLIKTAGKLNLARTVANMDVMNANLNLQRTYYGLLSRIKAAYFAVLVAEQSVIIGDALVRFTNEAYRIQVDQLKYGGVAAAYEPVQLRGLAFQARSALVQARNQYVAAWKRLAATLGTPNLPPAPLEGSANMAAPRLNYETALTRVLSIHPDVLAARNTLAQARVQLRLDQVKAIPDMNLYGAFQRDFTNPPFPGTSYNVQAGFPLPLFDRNQGGIVRARGQLTRASQELARASNDLTDRLAEAFARYETSRAQVIYYRDRILPDYATAYRGIYARHQQESAQVGFGDIIVAQQNLAGAIGAYLAALGAQWTAVADLANLLQAETLEDLGGEQEPNLPPPPPPNNVRQGGRR